VGTYIPGLILIVLGAIAVAMHRPAANPITAQNVVPDLGNFGELNLWASIAFAFAGLELSSAMGGEVRDPRRTLPRAILIAAPLIALVYILGTGALLWLVPTGDINIVSGFLQATEAAEAILAGLVTEALAGCRRVADLFCGIGPFALRLAEAAAVRAFDSDKAAVAALTRAHHKTRGLKPVEAARRDLFREPLTVHELTGLDGLVFDPPRAGAEAQAREIARSRVATVVAVSCEPKTFARDAGILIAGGYRLAAVTPVDQFAFSTHVELVGVFRR
jgi:hypothetical protein